MLIEIGYIFLMPLRAFKITAIHILCFHLTSFRICFTFLAIRIEQIYNEHRTNNACRTFSSHISYGKNRNSPRRTVKTIYTTSAFLVIANGNLSFFLIYSYFLQLRTHFTTMGTTIRVHIIRQDHLNTA